MRPSVTWRRSNIHTRTTYATIVVRQARARLGQNVRDRSSTGRTRKSASEGSTSQHHLTVTAMLS